MNVLSLVLTLLAFAVFVPLGATVVSIAKRNALYADRGVACNEVPRIAASLENILVPKWDGTYTPGRITAANAALFTESNAQERLSTFASGFRDDNAIEEAVEFFAPETVAPRRFDYVQFSKAEEFYSDGADSDLRAPRGDFAEVEYTQDEIPAKMENRGLMYVVDHDSEDMSGDWQLRYVTKLIRRLRRNQLRRGVTLLSAAATNTNVIWNKGVADVDPDIVVFEELIEATDDEGVAPNRVGYGHTAWARRKSAHRGSNTPGGFASAKFSREDLAGELEVEQVFVSKERFSTGEGVSQILANKVLMFNGMKGADRDDPSNIKLFYANTDQGGRFGVYVYQLNPKTTVIVVEHYEKMVITSTLGIRQFTVAAS